MLRALTKPAYGVVGAFATKYRNKGREIRRRLSRHQIQSFSLHIRSISCNTLKVGVSLGKLSDTCKSTNLAFPPSKQGPTSAALFRNQRSETALHSRKHASLAPYMAATRVTVTARATVLALSALTAISGLHHDGGLVAPAAAESVLAPGALVACSSGF